MDGVCGLCKYFQRIDSSSVIGYCQRYPPVPVATNGGVDTNWPYLLSSDWCGEFKKKE